jgi:hypothetical protein
MVRNRNYVLNFVCFCCKVRWIVQDLKYGLNGLGESYE